MSNLLKYLLVDRQFKFAGLRNELLDSISKVKGLRINQIDHNEIKIYPWFSIGTLVLKTGHSWFGGINLKAKLADNNSDLTKIRLLTTVRPEHFFIAGVNILILLLSPLDKDNSNKIIVDWILTHIGFQVVYRIQEELLIRKLTKRLGLVKM